MCGLQGQGGVCLRLCVVRACMCVFMCIAVYFYSGRLF